MSEAKKQAFIDYIKSNGVLDQLAKAVVQIYSSAEKPADAMDFIREILSEKKVETTDTLSKKILELSEENSTLKGQVKTLKEDNHHLRVKIATLEKKAD
ncbi:Associate of Myc 1 like protein [Aduncisulcus paluster]|uniref:Associate of Myc 1 like protein n=1 Tax=Aduncisulcus paluster TaxID=2918883 RepID=A0ABQ5K8L3_9EUKA|nr:Associate of Myc 1 like protein [Aduncisulcus paluster]